MMDKYNNIPANPDNISARKFNKRLDLTEFMKDKRLSNQNQNQKSNQKSIHSAVILTNKFDLISYGENNYRKTQFSNHAETDAIRNIKNIKQNKKYYLFVTKFSQHIGKLGNSCCCIKCNLFLLQNYIKINKIYYSIEDGIACRKLDELPIHISELDRKKNNEKTLKKLSNYK